MADVLARPWFTSLFVETTYDAAGQSRSQPLKEFQFDAILVLAHMDADDAAVDLLHETLRGYVGPNMAVAFAAGRTHRRARRELDGRAVALEAGRGSS